jgi:glutamate-1-semialdehyde 2,1-aminomutase
MKFDINQTWRNRAELAIAGGALTNSKRPSSFVEGVYPTHLTRGEGCFVWDTDKKKYIDFICGLGSNLLGYGNQEISRVIADRANQGATLSLGSTIEVEAAEKVKELMPFIERLRFLKSGTDACSAAMRIARTFRGKGEILSDGYHGWSDEFVSLTPPALGVYSEHMIAKFESLEQIDHDTAAVIIEPIVLDASDARREYLHRLRKKCDETGALLIFDEVITGFRVPEFCVAKYFGVTPDLVCLGKAMGGGMAVSAVGGRAEVMECGEYFVSSTFAGETLSLAASLKAMTLLQTKYDIQYLWERGGYFMERFNSIWPDGIRMTGYPTRGSFSGNPETIALFCQEACKGGLLFHPKSWFFNFKHLDLIDQVLNTCQDIMVRIRAGGVKLEGALPVAPFAARLRSA